MSVDHETLRHLTPTPENKAAVPPVDPNSLVDTVEIPIIRLPEQTALSSEISNTDQVESTTNTEEASTDPDTPQAPEQTNPVKKGSWKRVVGITATALGVSVIAGGIGLVVGKSSSDEATTPLAPAEQPATGTLGQSAINSAQNTIQIPAQSDVLVEKPQETTSATEPVAISAEQYETPEEIGYAVIDNIQRWTNYSANPDTAHYIFSNPDNLNPNDAVLQGAANIAKENTPLFTDTLFVSDWEQNPRLQEIVANTEYANSAVLFLYTLTANPTNTGDSRLYEGTPSVDIEPYITDFENTGVTVLESSDDTVTVELTYKLGANVDKNRAAKFLKSTEENQIVSTYTLQKTDGLWLISDVR